MVPFHRWTSGIYKYVDIAYLHVYKVLGKTFWKHYKVKALQNASYKVSGMCEQITQFT